MFSKYSRPRRSGGGIGLHPDGGDAASRPKGVGPPGGIASRMSPFMKPTGYLSTQPGHVSVEGCAPGIFEQVQPELLAQLGARDTSQIGGGESSFRHDDQTGIPSFAGRSAWRSR